MMFGLIQIPCDGAMRAEPRSVEAVAADRSAWMLYELTGPAGRASVWITGTPDEVRALADRMRDAADRLDSKERT